MHKSLFMILVVAALLTAATTLVIGSDRASDAALTTEHAAIQTSGPLAPVRSPLDRIDSERTITAAATRSTEPSFSPASSTCWASFSWYGENEGDGFGYAVSSAGDMNDDGWEDYLAGAFGYGEGNGWDDTGRVYVYSGFDGSLLHTIMAEGGGGWFGWSAASADLNNDGFDDLLVGSLTHSGSVYFGGRVYIFYGSATTRPSVFSAADAEIMISGQESYEKLGSAIVIMGEVDSIAGPDFAIGADHYQGIPPGEVFILSGQTLDTLFTLVGEGTGVESGFGALGPAGDVNGDGIPDLIVGEPEYNSDSFGGTVFVFSGADGSLLYKFTSDDVTGGDLGQRPSAAGDVNGDGYDDMLMAAQNAGANNNGSMYLFLGGPGPHPIVASVDSAYRTLSGGGSRHHLGNVCFVGDINQDSYDEYVAGVYQSYINAPGYVHIISGVDGAILQTWVGDESGDQFGLGLCSVGDRDGDGTGELLIGAFERRNPGEPTFGSGKAYLFEIGDVDADNLLATCDNCRMVYNPGQTDSDLDGIGDACDNCPADSGLNQSDTDTDGVGDICDNCPIPNPAQVNTDADSLGDACDNCIAVSNDDQAFTITMTGDVNLSGTLTSADIIALVNFTFKGGDSPEPCDASGDVNCSGAVTSADIIYMVNHVFKSMAAPCNVCTELGPNTFTCP